MAGPEGNVLPVYFVADESASMSSVIGELNSGLETLLDTMQGESMAAAKVRFCVIGFSNTAHRYLEPADVREVESMPVLHAQGGTSFSAAFRHLFDRIPEDVSNLKNAGYLVNRPVVFFLTDGEPKHGDGWEQELTALTAESFRARPNILAFGLGDANVDNIRRIASKPEYAFIAAAGVDTGSAITRFIEALTHSVVQSGQAVGTGQSELQIEKPDGFVSLAVETL